MRTKTAILVTAVFMLVTASASFAQNPTSEDGAIKPYPVCMTWRAKHAGTGTCRIAFMDARNALGYTCKQGKILPPENEGHEKIATYVAACGCERKNGCKY